MDQPKIPTLKDAQKPQVKIKGMGAGLTLFDRLKQFKKKDLAFILAGLGTLFMAPLAEHFMMAPEAGDASLQQGWGGKSGSGGANLFGSGSSPYENGNNNIAQGGAIGGAGDIITPLNVRDPSALVMGPGAQQQPNAGATTPAAPPVAAPPSGGEDYKDALKGAASRAASAAVKRSPLPVPKVSLGGTNLRGLGVAGGGTSATGSLGPIGPAAGSNGANGGGGGLNLVRSNPNFRGVAGARSPTGSGLDGTKKAGANAGDAFSRTGSALGGLNAAASEQIPTGGTGFGGGGQGGAGSNDKGPGGSGPGGSKSVGESLAFIEAKERMMENLKLEFEKRKLKDPELLLYGIRNDMLKAAGVKVGEALTKTAMCKVMGSGCPDPDAELKCNYYTGPASGLTPQCPAEVKTGQGACWSQTGNGGYELRVPGSSGPALDSCTPTGKGKTDGPGGKTATAPSGASPGNVASVPGGGVPPTRSAPSGADAAKLTSLDSACDVLMSASVKSGQLIADANAAKAKKSPSAASDIGKISGSVEDFTKDRAAIDAMITEAGKVVLARNSLVGGAAGKCNAASVTKSADGYHSDAITNLTAGKTGGIDAMKTSAVGEAVDGGVANAGLAKTAVDDAGKLITSVTENFGEDGGKVNMAVFSQKGLTSQTAQDATFIQVQKQVLAAKDAAVGQLKAQKELNAKLAPLVDYGAKAGNDKIPNIVRVNGEQYKAGVVTPLASLDPKIELPVAKRDTTKDTAAPTTTAEGDKKLQAVQTKIDAATADVQAGAEAVKAIIATRATTGSDQSKFEGTPEQKAAIAKAVQSVSDMQTIQTAQLDTLQAALKQLGGEVKPAGATPGVVTAK